MKKQFIHGMALPCFTLIFLCSAKAQPQLDFTGLPAKDSTPANCKWNLMQPVFFKYDSILNVSYAKTPFPVECKDVSYAADDSGSRCFPVDSCGSGEASLFYDVYYPLHDYSKLKLPVIILAHAGGFKECSNLRQPFMTNLCTAFAHRGFVVFNIEYRRGRVLDPTNNYNSYKTAQQFAAAYRASQDMRGAIRSIIKRERMQNQPYRIDTTKIFIGGASAGGVMSMNTAWYTNSMIYEAFPTKAGYPKIKNALGAIDADYYFGEPTIDFNADIKGVLVMWSGMFFPYKYKNHQSSFFTKARLKPVISFHGTYDHVFPFYMDTAQDIYFSPPPKNKTDFDYNKEVRCLIDMPFKVDDVAETADMVSASPLNIYRILDTLAPAIPKELYVDCNMSHGLDNDGPQFDSEFGTGLPTSPQVTVYIAERVSTFFQAVMNGATARNLSPSIFTECENTRTQCDYSANLNHCNNADSCVKPSKKPSLHSGENHYATGALKKESHISIYPNPVKNTLIINGLTANNTYLIVTDINGRVLKQTIASAASYKLDTHTLSPGIYFIKIVNDEQSRSLKFVKE